MLTHTCAPRAGAALLVAIERAALAVNMDQARQPWVHTHIAHASRHVLLAQAGWYILYTPLKQAKDRADPGGVAAGR